MNNCVDEFEIKQITENVHAKQTQIYIPCLKVYGDLIDDNDYSDSSEIFFVYSAFHKSKGIELKQRINPVRVFRTSPISDVLADAADIDYQENKSLGLSRAVQLIFSATEPNLFKSLMQPQISIFEKAIILKEECKNSANVVIISNDARIDAMKKKAEKESGKTFSEDDFKIMDTNAWLNEMFFKNKDSDVNSIVLSILEKKKTIKIGGMALTIKTE